MLKITDVKSGKQVIEVIPHCFEPEIQNKIQSPIQCQQKKVHRVLFKNLIICQIIICKEKKIWEDASVLKFYLVAISAAQQLKYKSV